MEIRLTLVWLQKETLTPVGTNSWVRRSSVCVSNGKGCPSPAYPQIPRVTEELSQISEAQHTCHPLPSQLHNLVRGIQPWAPDCSSVGWGWEITAPRRSLSPGPHRADKLLGSVWPGANTRWHRFLDDSEKEKDSYDNTDGKHFQKKTSFSCGFSD